MEHRIGDGAALPVARRLHAGQNSAQALEDELVDESAAVITDIDDHALLAELREKLLYESIETGGTHIGQIDIADLAMSSLVHFLAVGFHPIQFTQAIFVGNWLHLNSMSAVRRSLRIDSEGDGFVDGVDQQFVRSVRCFKRTSVDRNQVVTLLDVHPRLGQRRAQLRIPVFSRIDLLETIHAAGGIDGEIGAQ
jgi:hypothetical protein